MNESKSTKGITLIALVITIIVLLILVAVAISTLTGENGILSKAVKATEETKRATAKEQVEIAVLASYDKDGKLNIDKLKEELGKIGIDTSGIIGLATNITLDGFDIVINEDGTVKVEGETTNPPVEKTEITAKDISNSSDKSEYYGAIVTGYDCENSAGVNAWKIFYADENNIYLIADDYIASTYVPKGKGGSTLNQGDTDYKLYFTNILPDYAGSSDITDVRIKALNSDYFTKGYTSTNNNMKAVAYMLDTSVWNVFKGEKAEYAVGGPTIEMLMNSYSQKHNVDYRAQASSNLGYQISEDGGINWLDQVKRMLDRSDSLYTISTAEKAGAMWVASPCDKDNKGEFLFHVEAIGTVQYQFYHTPQLGFRPLVCLKSNVQLKKVSDGTYTIK